MLQGIEAGCESEAGSLHIMNGNCENLGGNHGALSIISPAKRGHSGRRPSMKPFHCESRGDRRRRAGAALICQSLLFAGSLMAAPLGLAADQHSNHGSVDQQGSAEKIIYREGGAILHDRMMEEIKR